MELRLETAEADLLRRILTNYLADLRMEISDTDSAPLRESLKHDEATIGRIIARLAPTSAAPA